MFSILCVRLIERKLFLYVQKAPARETVQPQAAKEKNTYCFINSTTDSDWEERQVGIFTEKRHPDEFEVCA